MSENGNDPNGSCGDGVGEGHDAELRSLSVECPIPSCTRLFPFRRDSIIANVERRAGLYVVGHMLHGQLVPMYVGRSDCGRQGKNGHSGVRGRLLSHHSRCDLWVQYRKRLTHFAVAYIDDPVWNFELESWHFHHYRLPLNGGGHSGGGHPIHPRIVALGCSEPGCYHLHRRFCGVKMSEDVKHGHRLPPRALFQEWRLAMERRGAEAWGYKQRPEGVFEPVLVPPLVEPVKLSPMSYLEHATRKKSPSDVDPKMQRPLEDTGPQTERVSRRGGVLSGDARSRE